MATETVVPTIMNSANVCGQRRKEHHATPMNQTVSKAVFPIRPILSGLSFFFSNPYPKYVPHGFTPRPAPPYYSAAKSKNHQRELRTHPFLVLSLLQKVKTTA